MAEYEKLYHQAPSKLFSSPGRLELLGNHTDHQHGLVLVSAVNLDILAAAGLSIDNHIVIHSQGFPAMDVDLADLRVRPAEAGTSAAIVRGVADGFQSRGFHIGGFTAYMESAIFPGAGVSSSASFELLMCEILNYFYNDDQIGKVELAKIGQASETGYFGKPCGLLDQMGVALGGVNYIDFRSTANPEYKHITLNLKGYRIVLTNTGGSHAELTPLYSGIKADLKKISAFFGKDVLREVPEEEFEKHKDELIKAVGPRAVRRAIHIYSENKRVEQGFMAIEKNDIPTFIRLIGESGHSSRDLLDNVVVADAEKEALSSGLRLSEELIHDGAVRVHGGGFAGTMLAFVSEKEAPAYLKAMKARFGEGNSLFVQSRPDGVKALK